MHESRSRRLSTFWGLPSTGTTAGRPVAAREVADCSRPTRFPLANRLAPARPDILAARVSLSGRERGEGFPLAGEPVYAGSTGV
jgi:hypothetical protein